MVQVLRDSEKNQNWVWHYDRPPLIIHRLRHSLPFLSPFSSLSLSLSFPLLEFSQRALYKMFETVR